MTRGEKIITVAGIGVLAWIIYANWFRKGNVSVESVDSQLQPIPVDPYSSGGAYAAYDLNKMQLPALPIIRRTV